MPVVLDNIKKTVEDTLVETLKSSMTMDVAVGYFNLRGWSLIADAVDRLPEPPEGKPKVRILVGITETPQDEMRRQAWGKSPEPVDQKTAVGYRATLVEEFREQLQIGLPVVGDEATLQTLRRQISDGDVEVRLHTAYRLHAKLYLCHRTDTVSPRAAYVGSSNLTHSGLRTQGELNVDETDKDATMKLAHWFDDRWSDRLSLPVMPQLIGLLDESWASGALLDPYLVYLKMAYHLSKEAREGLISYGLPASMQQELLEFQAAAVKIAARIVTQKNGAMIGDVVGLGKTLVGTAIARLLQEENGYETLVVCPKNLKPMWEGYLHEYEVRGKVESLSMVHKVLPKERRHRLVIIDEAHNLRNEKRRDHRALKAYISDNDSKVLLLTATPYNKDLADLAAQLSLFLDNDADLGVRPNRAIAEVGEVDFELACRGQTSTLAAFKRSEHLEDWQMLMSHYLIRRTRRFVEDNYADIDSYGRTFLRFGDGTMFYFPKRIPKPVERVMADGDPAKPMISDRTLNAIRDLKLPRPKMGTYLNSRYKPAGPDEAKLLRDLLEAARGNIAGFNRIMMFKRLSSSGPAFLATLRRHRLRNLVAVHALDNNLPVPVGSVSNTLWPVEIDIDGDDIDDEGTLIQSREITPDLAYARLEDTKPRGVRWAPPKAFQKTFREDLVHDADVIGELLDRFGKWTPKTDGKMNTLEELVTEQHPDEKVLVFTEAADTANYVVEELRRRGIEGVALVTGNSENPTRIARRFSPVSNRSQPGELGGELQIVVSTDVLSEGQNLQDSHIVVNYDLPWALVKLIQRAGRVDRIGQKSPEVLLYSLMPSNKLEGEITLRGRIRERLAENAQLLGSDEKFFGDEREREVIRGLYDETSGYMLTDGVDDVDPVSMAYEIWRNAQDRHPELAQRASDLPNVVHSTRATSAGDQQNGVLVHSQTVTGSDAFAFVSPVGEQKQITAQEALTLATCQPSTTPLPRLTDHYELIAAAFDGPLRTPPGQATGALQGVRGRVWQKLDAHMDTFTDNLLFTLADIQTAHDAMNDRPLRESATQTLSKAVNERSPEDLAALVVNLWQDDMLCIPPQSTAQAEPSIICAMGFR
ncbi:MAG: helicase-related protein [bacterium]|nr:helicase-related protein [bacterium]